jgi:signal transduction histidine kinase
MRSLRSQLIAGSILWTIGVLLVVSVLLIGFLAVHPRPHAIVLGWMMALPATVSFTIGAGCMAAGALRIRRSMTAVDRLRGTLAAVHRGEEPTVAGSYPAEVQPLVEDLNALLTERDDRVRRAVAKAGDLAHGLKTPLAVLTCDAARAAEIGELALADSMRVQVERMRRHVEYHLAHARAAVGSKVAVPACVIAPCVEALIRTLERLHADRSLTFEVAMATTHAVRCQREDLDEMLGNLLDNACKWGRSCVRIASTAAPGAVILIVDDDGPGIEVSLAEAVLQRGVRADEAVPGSGLGLAIVRDLAELYEGSLELQASPLGGVSARLRLPAGPAA